MRLLKRRPRRTGRRGLATWSTTALSTAMVALAVTACSSGSTADGANHYSTGHRPSISTVSGTTLNGSPFALSSLRGHVVVVNFWGSWCADCHQEEPAFEQLSTTDRARGVRFVGVNVRDNVSQARDFERQYKMTYPTLSDPTGQIGLQFDSVALASYPTTIVLDRGGRVAARVSGALDYTHLRSLVDGVLKESA